jgi:hypothetical protein
MKTKLLQTLLILILLSCTAFAQQAQYVIHISVDGGGSSYIQALIDKNKLPNFKRLQTEGAGTFNARTDYDVTVTLPNHTTQITGRPVLGADGHNWILNALPAKGKTIHNNKDSYTAGIFDVVHDNGLSTGMFAGKTKFSLYEFSYNADNGAADTTGTDNGRKKIDLYVCDEDSRALAGSFISTMTAKPPNYAFLHFADPDAVGHKYGWGSDKYNESLMAIDDYLCRIFNLVNCNETLKGKTIVVLTADHGGNKRSHSKADDPLDYTIPFFVWGPGVTPGADLYALNPDTRFEPGADRPKYSAPIQPIRNGDSANLELKLLGLPPVPGSTINSKQDLQVSRNPQMTQINTTHPTRITTSRFGPCTPRISVFSISDVRLGPVTKTNSPRNSRSAARRATFSQAAGKCSYN